MSALPEPTFAVRMSLLGVELHKLTAIKSYRLSSNFMTATDGWEFVAIANDQGDTRQLQNLSLQPVELLVDGKPQVVGRVDTVTMGDAGGAVTFSGRDYLADLVECHVDPSLRLKKGLSLRDVITLACGPCGIKAVASADELALRNLVSGRSHGVNDPGLDFKALKAEDYKPNPGEGMYAFVNRILARHRCTMQPTPNDRTMVVLAQPMFSQEASANITRRIGAVPAEGNNVISGRATRGYGSMPTHVLVTGKSGAAGRSKAAGAAEVNATNELVRIVPPAPDAGFSSATALSGSPEVDPLLFAQGRILPEQAPGLALGLGELYRLHYRRDTEARTAAHLAALAYRLFVDRYKDTLRYEATLQGHYDLETGALWSVDTIVQVRDEQCGIDEPLWVEGRELSYDAGSGPTTRLTCWRPGTFLLGAP